MKKIVLIMGAYSAAALGYEFTTPKLIVCCAATFLLPLALTVYGKRLAAKMDADKKAALKSIAHRKDLERQLADLKRNNPWTRPAT